MRLRNIDDQAGFVTIIALLMVGMLTLLGLAAISTSDDEVQIAGNTFQETKTFWAAEAGLSEAAASLQQDLEEGNLASGIPLGDRQINNCSVEFTAVTDGAVSNEVLSSGSLAGLHAQVQTYSISSTASNNVERARITLSESFQAGLIPIFQFAVFYDYDLEIAPGPAMTLGGRVHTNGNLYLQANASLHIDGVVSAAMQIFHGRKGPGGGGVGNVLIRDAHGNYAGMKEPSGWLDAFDAEWYQKSTARWGSRVQDMNHGQGRLNVPLTNSNDAHRLIERGDDNPDSYEHKASLIIKDGVVSRQESDGSWTDVTAGMTADGVLKFTNDQFYDKRESKWVDCTELDIDLMFSEGYAPENGVLYFADTETGSTWPALRLKNGSRLEAGLTVASENPLYTLGDYNSVKKKPASLMADAITFLSNAWEASGYDAQSTKAKGQRIASNTVVNCSYLTGNVETTVTGYNGGFENLPRFLEKWSNKNFSWTGSAVNLWNSVQADSKWNGNYYSPPRRDWGYDSDLDDPSNLPPATPMAQFFQRTDWKQEDVGWADWESDESETKPGNGGGNGNGNGGGNGGGKGK